MTDTTPPPPGQRTCAVCSRILNSRTHSDGTVTWEHTLQDQTYDHPALPVAPDAVHTEYRCDFCNMDQSSWILPVRNFPMPGVANAMAGEDWSACNICGHLINTNQWTALMRRTEAVYKLQHGEPMDEIRKKGLTVLWRAVRKNITGSLRPFIRPDSRNPRPQGETGGASVADGQTRARTAFNVDRTGRHVPETR